MGCLLEATEEGLLFKPILGLEDLAVLTQSMAGSKNLSGNLRSSERNTSLSEVIDTCFLIEHLFSTDTEIKRKTSKKLKEPARKSKT
jgi:hypothetical protein